MNPTINLDELLNTYIKDIVISNYKTAELLEKHNIDFCCNGKRLLKEVLESINIEGQTIINELLDVLNREEKQSNNFGKITLTELIDYIVNIHHKYVTEAIPKIKMHLEKVVSKHGEKYPYLSQIDLLFKQISKELENHMLKEEQILFPFIKYLVDCQKFGDKPKTDGFGTIRNPIHQMEIEHDSDGYTIHKIRHITDNYKLPEDACTTFTLTYEELKEFGNDLHKHNHLENYILFPKAIELEDTLIKIQKEK